MRTETMPDISTTFTVDDIRKLRDWNGERFANMTHSEIIDDVNDGAAEFMALVENARSQQVGVASV